MADLEPVNEILKNAHSEANSILKTARANSNAILVQVQKDADDAARSLKNTIISEVEKEFNTDYSRKKISYNKKVQDALSSKINAIKHEIINDLLTDKSYPSIMTSFATKIMSAYPKAKIRAGADAGILSKKYDVIKERKDYHGFFLDLGNKTVDYSLEYTIDKYLSEHPVKLI